jgi:hypothetical protein
MNFKMIPFLLASAALVSIVGCQSKPKLNEAMLEKYPYCYNKNIKISNKCIEKNEAGQKTTAMELENTAYPGQYQ